MRPADVGRPGRRSPSQAASLAVEFVVDNADEGGPDDQALDAMQEALRILTPPKGRFFGVCVGGGCVRPEDEEIRCPLRALRRAEELKAEFPDEPIQILLWGDTPPAEEEAAAAAEAEAEPSPVGPGAEFVGASDDVVAIVDGAIAAEGILVDVGDGLAVVRIIGEGDRTFPFAQVAHPDSPRADAARAKAA